MFHGHGMTLSVRPTGNIAVAAQDEESDVNQQLIVLFEPAVRNKGGDREATLRMLYVSSGSERLG